ncbi:MAG TPA: glycosyltransferase family 4 protein [Longimicrobiales bacterium]|nr:glycosyltransferase family 4 protein [Longimicrobiales bacterium]
MRILVHCVYFPPEVGGLESHIFHLYRGLVARGHEVDAVTSRSRPGLAPHEVMDGVRVWRTWLPARTTPGWAAHAFFSMPRFGALARQADVLHAQDIAAVLPCMVAQRVRNAPLVTTYHTSHFLQRASSPFWRPIFRRFLMAADRNLAASAEIASVAEAVAPGVRVEPVTNGVDTYLFRRVAPALPAPAPGRRRVVVPRRLFAKNGVEHLVRALPQIAAEVDVEALVIGEGPERAALERLASELGVAERTLFLGARPNRDMPALLSAAELAVIPSLVEATSVAALEAMACELPVAASRVGGLPEIVDDEVGGLFEPGDPAALARVVIGLLRSGRLREMGQRARERVVERWSNERLVDRHVAIYEEVLERRRAA